MLFQNKVALMKIEHIQKKNKLPYPMLTKRLDLVEKIERKSNNRRKRELAKTRRNVF